MLSFVVVWSSSRTSAGLIGREPSLIGLAHVGAGSVGKVPGLVG